ncbi:sulfate permease [Sulfurospirillum oryzae]|uniref:sulfate permease n=1 Tax=Sulfurospirillum oryzae TaxID=2976535 RepID=UPI0021E71800|nr:sulfate permease [Sulfurospirillum oryzae]
MKFNYWLPRSIAILKEGYSISNLSADFMAGTTVAIIALPLAMAFAIASGVSPEKGIFTAVIAGFLISFLGGSRYQIGGPTGAFVVILYAIVLKHGYDGLALATLMAGVMLMLMGFFRLGSIIKFIPYPVTVGFTAGIALIIFSSQMKDFFGFNIAKMPAEFADQWVIYAENASHFNVYSLVIGFLSVIVLLNFRKIYPKIPAPIIVIVLSSIVVALFQLPVETIGSRFGSIPSTLPSPSIPLFSLEKVRAVFSDAITIALLGAIESLLSCVVADGMSGDKHHSNKELIAQGLANIAAPLFGGIAATGAIARTATNIKAGAFSPISGMIHALMLLIFMFLFSKWILLIPMAALAAILVVVAWNMSEFHHFKAIALKSEKYDKIVLFTTFFLTLFIDLNTGVQMGILFAALLFIKRMSLVTDVKDQRQDFSISLDEEDEEVEKADPYAISNRIVPAGVEVYEINGPFFFGVADKLKGVLDSVSKFPEVFILRMRHVPMMDATGFHALEEFYELCKKGNAQLVLSGVSETIKAKLKRFGFDVIIGEINITDNIDLALARANDILLKKEQEKFYAHIKISKERVSEDQKERIIAGTQHLLMEILGKKSTDTVVEIEEEEDKNALR